MRALALVTSLALTGCSFLFTSGPPAQHRQLPYFECSTSRAAPIADTIFGVLQVAGIAVTASQSEAEYNEANEVTKGGRDPIIKRNTSIGLNVLFGAMWGLSAYTGYTRTSACRAAKTELVIRASTGQYNYGTGPQPQPYQPQPYGPRPYAPQPQPYAPAHAPAPAPAPAPEPAPEPGPISPDE